MTYNIADTPMWIWIGFAIILAHTAALLGWYAFQAIRLPKPMKTVDLGDTLVELWVPNRKLRVQENKIPCTAGAIIVPVAPDMKMVAGIAKWVRDSTANVVQEEALEVAPMEPGFAFAGAGGRYRFGTAILAVVMDDQKRTSHDWIVQGIVNGLEQARLKEADTCFIPDMTDDLIQQPKSITPEQRRQTCEPVARAITDGILAGRGKVQVIRIWLRTAGTEDIWLKEMKRLEVEANAPAKAA